MLDILTEYNFFGAMWITIQLSLLAAVGALVLGTLIAVLRVSPVGLFQRIGAGYVNIVRNTPLSLLMIFSVLGLTFVMGWNLSDRFDRNAFWWAVIVLIVYHATYVAESLRSGVNTVPLGQAEAARSIGLTFSQSMREVILPQTFRGALAPLGSTAIALVKNTTVAALILGTTTPELAGLLTVVVENKGGSLPTFLLFALPYVILTLPLGILMTTLSRKYAVKR